jgi:hypothetical protein
VNTFIYRIHSGLEAGGNPVPHIPRTACDAVRQAADGCALTVRCVASRMQADSNAGTRRVGRWRTAWRPFGRNGRRSSKHHKRTRVVPRRTDTLSVELEFAVGPEATAAVAPDHDATFSSIVIDTAVLSRVEFRPLAAPPIRVGPLMAAMSANA